MIRDPFIEAYPELVSKVEEMGAEVKVLYTDNGIKKEELLQQVEDVDIIVVAIVKIDKDVIDAARKVKYIIKFGAGYDNIDFMYAKQKGILVTNAPGQNSESVADHAFGLMLNASREISKKNSEVKTGHWELSVGTEIFRKRLGIIGFGSIGQAIARRANGFQMDTLAFGNYKDLEKANELHVRFVELQELLSTADYIVISTSLTEKNHQMINKETLALMKPTSYLINISRGALIDEEALIEALNENKISGAALDVFQTEPPLNDVPKHPKVLATPHIGGSTYESIAKIGEITINNIRKFLEKEDLDFLV